MRRPSLQRPRQLPTSWKLNGPPCSPLTGEYPDLVVLFVTRNVEPQEQMSRFAMHGPCATETPYQRHSPSCLYKHVSHERTRSTCQSVSMQA